MSRYLTYDRKVKPPVYTVEECRQCHVKNKRPFKERDYVYKIAGECSQCKGQTMITMIYSEALKPS